MPPDMWLAAHTVAELRVMCSDRGIAYSGLRKAELVEAIMEHD
ncbi:MAG: SAP domain-containing protein [Phycisphaerales bacterium]|nr:SAP domain-containing protein [Phycisphaerales bacterium]